jgi:uncharacterized protein YjbJ (UPF0337 family)
MTAKSDQVRGKAKQVTGIVTGDKDLEAEGHADRLSAETAEKIDHAQSRAHHVVDTVEEFVDGAFDKTKDVVDRFLDKVRELIR